MMNTLLKNEIDEMNEMMQEELTGFKVDNLESANWCFRKIRALKEKKSEIDRIAEDELCRIESWRNEENKSTEGSIQYFEGLITEYYLKARQDDPKIKLSTPYGKVTSRKANKWNYNEDAIKQWCKDSGHMELIRVKEELDKSALKKTFKGGINVETGEIIPGINITEEESISIKVE